jgi:hypothetical protein
MAAPSQKTAQGRLFEAVLSELDRLGYTRGELLQLGYRFEDVFLPDTPAREVDAAAFGQTPFSYDTACFAVVCSNGKSGEELISDYRSLGAPRAFEIRQDQVLHWRISADPSAKQKPLVIQPNELSRAFQDNYEYWKPESILRAKNIGPVGPRQRDFIDLGLIPALEEHVRLKLDPLLRETFFQADREYRERTGKEPDFDQLFRLVFRVLAGKAMHDSGCRGFEKVNPIADPDSLLHAVADYYNDRQPALDDAKTKRLVTESLWGGISFKNISAEVLAYVWENTLVDDAMREKYGIHATPPSIARYIVHRLPIRDIPQNERMVVEPCCGSGVFLFAALQRLRELLLDPPLPDPKVRHEYFKNRLSGFDIENPGLEMARHCLMLADFPNADGWRLVKEDVFFEADKSPKFHAALQSARVVLCNPPFQSFDKEDRQLYKLRSVYKPAELLERVLDRLHPQGLLGFVLPLQFLSGQGYGNVRQRLVERFEEIEVVSLPGEVFAHAEHETALLITKHPRVAKSDTARLLQRKVEDGGWTAFNSYQKVKREDARTKPVKEASGSFAVVDLQDVWDCLKDFPTVATATDGEVHRGIEWNISLKENRDLLISDTEKDGFKRGVPSAPRRRLRYFQCPPTKFLCVKPEYQLYRAFDLPWDRPKVIMNAKRKSRSPWRLAAFADKSGLLAYQTYTCLWPSKQWSANVLAAVLNGPVASAFVAVHRGNRDIPVETIKDIPVPRLSAENTNKIEFLVDEYLTLISRFGFDAKREDRSLRRVLLEIDATVLCGYDLPPKSERKLLDYFGSYGHKRPVPFDFGDYFPADFRPCFSLAEYISEEFRLSTAKELKKRYKPAPEDVLRALRIAGGADRE